MSTGTDVACEIVTRESGNAYETLGTEYYARVPHEGEFVEYEKSDGELTRERVISVIHTDDQTAKARLVVQRRGRL